LTVQLLIAAAIIVVVVAAARLLRRRLTAAAPTQAGGWAAPAQLDRADFDGPNSPWLVVVFSSATCDSCADMVRKAKVMACPQVAVHEAEAAKDKALHRRYRIEAVPITVVADAAGVVRASFVGPASATDLWAAVAEVRSPGTTPEPGLGRPSA
jgi:hypothetical protein